jgi:hypothetical protein
LVSRKMVSVLYFPISIIFFQFLKRKGTKFENSSTKNHFIKKAPTKALSIFILIS